MLSFNQNEIEERANVAESGGHELNLPIRKIASTDDQHFQGFSVHEILRITGRT